MKRLADTSEQLIGLLVHLLALAFREMAPPLQEVDPKVVLIPPAGYKIAKAINNRPDTEPVQYGQASQ